MDEQRIHNKLDKIIDDVTEMKLTQIKQQAVLEHHVYRCDLLEENQETLTEQTAKAFAEVRHDLIPLNTFKDNLLGAAKWSGILLTVAGLIIGAMKIISH